MVLALGHTLSPRKSPGKGYFFIKDAFPSSSGACGDEVMERLGSQQDVLPAPRHPLSRAMLSLFLAGPLQAGWGGELSPASAPNQWCSVRAPPAPLSSWPSDHILSLASGCVLCSRGASQSSLCVPRANVALPGKSDTDVAEPRLLQLLRAGTRPRRVWGGAGKGLGA